MPRKALIRSGEWPYHVTARRNNREPFPCSLEEVWRFLTNEWFVQAVLHDLKLHAFVLMPNHFHMLLTVPSGDLDRAMKGFMESSTRIINVRSQRSGHLWGGRYYWSIIKSPIYFAHALKYVYRNPVKAGLSAAAVSYPYSTLGAIIGHAAPAIPLAPPRTLLASKLPTGIWDLVDWIEQPYLAEELEALRRALRRREFQIPVSPSNRKPLAIEKQI